MRNGFGWWRLAKQVVIGTVEAVVSAAQSTFTLNAYVIDVSDTTTLTADGVVNDSGGSPMEGISVSDALAACTIDGAACVFSVDDAEIADDGVESCTLSCHVYDTQTGAAVPDIATARFSLSGTTNLTVTPVDTATNANGRHRWTVVSSTAASYTIGGTVDGVSITDTVGLTVTGASGLPTMDWFSDYSVGGTGTSATAYQDGTTGGKWPGAVSNAAGLEVVDAATEGLTDCPTTNALKVTALETPGSGFHRCRQEDLPVPGENESCWRRWYMRVAWTYEATGGDNSNHPVEGGQTGGAEEWTFLVQNQSGGGWRPRIRSMSEEDSGPGGAPDSNALTYFEGPTLDLNAFYRFELQVERLTGDEFHMHMRVYDADDVLVAENEDFNNANGTGTLEAFTSNYGSYTIGERPLFHFASGDGSRLDQIDNGLNGAGGTVWYPSRLFAYQTGFAASRDTWCGAYNASNG